MTSSTAAITTPVSPPPRPFQVLAKATGPKCNLNCEYCFYKPKEDDVYELERKFRMSGELLENYIRDYIDSQAGLPGREITFLWQGGEPTMRGIDFFRRAVDLQQRLCPPGKTICNHFQTNGILIDEEWAQFFAEHDFLIGISIDGPQFVHDQYRKTLKGAGSFDRVVAGLNWLKQYRVEFNTMTVVGRHNFRLGREVYDALKALGSRHMQFIPLVERITPQQRLTGPGEQPHSQVSKWSVPESGYGHFLNAVFDRWIEQDVGSISVQMFEIQLNIRMNRPAGLCIFAPECGQGVVLEHNGDVYSCDHYVYPEYYLGNASQTPISELVQSKQQLQFGRDKYQSLPTQCRRCPHLSACYGGCPKQRFLETRSGEPGLNYLCKSYRHFFEHSGRYFDTIAALVRRGEPAARVMEMVKKEPSTLAVSGRNSPCRCGSGKKTKQCCGR